MKFNTLSTIIDDLLLTIRNNNIAESENISRRQIEQWIHTYRTYLLKQDIDKDGDIDPQYIKEIKNVPLVTVDGGHTEFGTVDYCHLQADISLPKLIDLNHRSGLISVTDLNGNPIQIGTKTKAKYQKNRKYACNDYIAVQNGNKLDIYGPGIIRFVNIEILPEDPSDAAGCYDENAPYPIPADKLPALKELIFQKEFKIMLSMNSDNTNNTENELSNYVR